MNLMELKRALYDEYGGFSDKRIKKLDKGSQFIVDDRRPDDFGADKDLYPWFCPMFARVVDDDEVAVALHGNVPVDSGVRAWLETRPTARHAGGILEITVHRGEQVLLSDLATAVRSITARPGYAVNSYKYVCPRTSDSLDRLRAVLDRCWSEPSSAPPKPLDLFP